jgi:hypothetical protein
MHLIVWYNKKWMALLYLIIIKTKILIGLIIIKIIKIIIKIIINNNNKDLVILKIIHHNICHNHKYQQLINLK